MIRYSLPSRKQPLLKALVAILLVLAPVHTFADSREDAIKALDRIQKKGASLSLPDEVRSIEATFEVAESYHEDSMAEFAERFYLLAIQKANVLESYLAERAAPSAPSTQPAPPPAATVADLPPDSWATTPDKGAATVPESGDTAIVSSKLIGSSGAYTVLKGDTLRLVAAKLGVSRAHMIKMNGLSEKSALKEGQKLVYNNRKIIPHRMKDGIVINIPDRTLYYFQRGKLFRSLPVAVGSSTKNDKYVWQTPVGKFRITGKQKDPTWYVPSSIQTEMEERGREVITSIPPGPENPLGKYAIKTSIPGIMIHSTTKPWSIYSFSSHGCIRVYPDHMEDLFKEIKVNTPGEIIYKPVKLAVTEEGRVFLEIHRDVYGMTPDLAGEVRGLIAKQQLEEKVDWQKVDLLIKKKTGIAEDVTL